jgi:hypothetical protein
MGSMLDEGSSCAAWLWYYMLVILFLLLSYPMWIIQLSVVSSTIVEVGGRCSIWSEGEVALAASFTAYVTRHDHPSSRHVNLSLSLTPGCLANIVV